MSANRRHHFASKLVRCLTAAGFLGAIGCTDADPTAPPGPGPDPQPPTPVEERIERELERLDALEVLDLGELATTRTEHQWAPEGGAWTSSAVAMTGDEQVARLASLADVAEQAVAPVGPDSITELDVEALCYALDTEKFCLTIDMHAANLHHINQLEIVEVVDIIRSAPAATGFCYSSWETVGQDDCVRALKLGAIVDATRDLPSADPPEGEPE